MFEVNDEAGPMNAKNVEFVACKLTVCVYVEGAEHAA